MQEKEIKILFDGGALSKATVVYTATSGGFIYLFNYMEKKKDPAILMTQRGQQKVAKTLDSALELVKRIGFKKFEVQY